MQIEISDVVVSLRGRDVNNYFVVVGLNGDYATIADGRQRRLEKPKLKKLKHLKLVCHGEGRTFLKLRAGEKITNGEIRRALADMLQEPEA